MMLAYSEYLVGSGVSKEPLDQPATDRSLAPNFVFKPREYRNAARICLGETAACCEAAGCFALLALGRGALIAGIRQSHVRTIKRYSRLPQ
jgi:hypothetical protein